MKSILVKINFEVICFVGMFYYKIKLKIKFNINFVVQYKSYLNLVQQSILNS